MTVEFKRWSSPWRWFYRLGRAVIQRVFYKLFTPRQVHIGILGTKGSGKTVFLARFYEYLREKMADEWNATADDEETRRYLYETLEKIYQGELEETIQPHLLNLTITRGEDGFYHSYVIRTIDISGRDFAQSDYACKSLDKFDGGMFLIDPMRVSPEEKEVYERVLKRLAHKRTRSLLTFWTPPLAFVFTKLDHPDTPEELREDFREEEVFESHSAVNRARFYAQKVLPGNFKTVAARFRKVNYFAISSFGDWLEKTNHRGEKVLVPDPDKPPVGLHTPMEWLCDEVIYRKCRLNLYRLALVLLFGGGVALAWYWGALL